MVILNYRKSKELFFFIILLFLILLSFSIFFISYYSQLASLKSKISLLEKEIKYHQLLKTELTNKLFKIISVENLNEFINEHNLSSVGKIKYLEIY